MEDAHPLHAAALAAIAYVATQSVRVSAGVGGVAWVYMAVFGHSLPDITTHNPFPQITLTGFEKRRRDDRAVM